jgi:predicted dehydrogenase
LTINDDRGRVRVSLAGCGRWGRHILRDLLALGAEVAVADPNPEARLHAAATGASKAVSDLGELGPSDGIIIATPASTHAAVIQQALTGSGPVFVEKPLTNDARAARLLAEQGRNRLFVMDKWRYHPGIEELRRIRESGELGRVLGLHIQQVGWGSPQRDVDVAWTLLPHSLGIALEVLGEVPRVKQAFAECLDGAVVGMNAVLGGAPWVVLEISGRAPAKRREFRLHCEDGVAWLDDAAAHHIRLARGGPWTGADAQDVQQRTISTELPLLAELRAFVGHLRGGPKPRSSAEEGALAVERIHELHVLGVATGPGLPCFQDTMVK